jgi:hypothetical protein
MGRRGHHASRLKRAQRIDDPLIVRGDDCFPHQLALLHLLNHVLHEWLSGEGGENLGWESGRPVTGGNDNGCSQESILIATLSVVSKLRSESSDQKRGCQTY